MFWGSAGHAHVLWRFLIWTVEFLMKFEVLVGVTEMTEILNPPPLLGGIQRRHPCHYSIIILQYISF